MNPKVSVILTTYQNPKMLKQAAASVLNQTIDDWECWIVDDNSKDETWEIAHNLAVLDARFKPLKSDLPRSAGWTVTRYCHSINYAFPFTEGKFITYLCDDDLFMPFRLDLMCRFMDSTPDAMICYGKQLVLDIENPDFAFVRPMPGVTRKAAQQIDHSSVLHRRECFEKVDGWNEGPEYREIGDAGFWERLNEHWDFHPIEEILDIHRYNPGSVNAEAIAKHKAGIPHNPLKCEPGCEERIRPLAKEVIYDEGGFSSGVGAGQKAS